MKKADRQQIFNKYGGKCAYCGVDLEKGWHVDEIEPCRRKQKLIKAHWSDPLAKHMTEDEMIENNVKWIPDKWVFNGYDNPENLHIGNQNPACASCNINKHSESIEAFRALISGFIGSLNKSITQYKIAKRYGLILETPKPVVFYFETINTI